MVENVLCSSSVYIVLEKILVNWYKHSVEVNGVKKKKEEKSGR